MKTKLLLVFLAITIAIAGVIFVLSSENALIVHPKGLIAHQELTLIKKNILIMLAIIFPTYIVLFTVVWKYCIKKSSSKEDLLKTSNPTTFPINQFILWVMPTIIVMILAVVTWKGTHALNPYKPIDSETQPLIIQVIAMDWKWLFIYPEQGIASMNYMQIPENTPIHLKLTADGSPMNSFWIPQLSGQIYSMTGMSTQLHLISDALGEYKGRAVEINGDGYSDMTFLVKSTSLHDFNQWISVAKESPSHLTKEVYKKLVSPSIDKSQILFSEVENDLYLNVVHQYMYPTTPVL